MRSMVRKLRLQSCSSFLIASTATIAQLATRKQNYKLSMFKWLHRILLLTVLVIAIFFVVSSLTFSGRLAEGTLHERPSEVHM